MVYKFSEDITERQAKNLSNLFSILKEDISFIKDNQICNAKSYIGIMSLNILANEEIEIVSELEDNQIINLIKEVL